MNRLSVFTPLCLIGMLSCTRTSSDHDSASPPDTLHTADTEQTGSDTGTVVEEIPAAGDLQFSHPHGFYSAPFELSIAHPFTGGTLQYTLDGSDPTLPDATPYTQPISISTTTVVRVALMAGERAVSLPVSQTYVFADDIAEQQPDPALPTEWWSQHETGPYTADYTMDPEVTKTTEWTENYPALLESIPLVSLVVAPEDLYGELGLYENPEERGEEWERAGSVEILYADGREGVSAGCGVRIHGGAGRKPDRSPKKSFRLLFKSEYGPAELVHDLYDGVDVREFNTLVLRAGYNRTWVSWSDGGRERAQYSRELFAAQTQRDMGHHAPHARPVHLMLNGLYWGVYLIQERPDARSQASHMGGTEEDYDAYNAGELVDGTEDGWDNLLEVMAEDLSNEDAYAAAADALQIDPFIDYMLLNLAYGNIDWPEKNWWAGQNRTDGSGFVFFNWDAEFIFRYTYDDLTAANDEDSPGWMLQQLRQNEEFVVRFGDRIEQRMKNGGALSEEATVARWQNTTAMVVPAIIGESARWGDHWRDVRNAAEEPDTEAWLYTYGEHWLDADDYMKSYFFPTRYEKVFAIFQEAGLYPTIEAPVLSQHGGDVVENTEISVTAAEGSVHVTTDGTDPRQIGGEPNPDASVDPGSIVVVEDTVVRARAWVDGEWSPLVDVAFAISK